jgi:hypothetical protein
MVWMPRDRTVGCKTVEDAVDRARPRDALQVSNTVLVDHRSPELEHGVIQDDRARLRRIDADHGRRVVLGRDRDIAPATDEAAEQEDPGGRGRHEVRPPNGMMHVV